MAVTSSESFEVMAGSGHNTRISTRGSTAAAVHAHARDLRTAQQQKPHKMTARIAIHHAGAGTLRSAAWTWLTSAMMRTIPCSSRAVAAAGTMAAHGPSKAAQNV